jgi:hypothetical protein
MKLFHVLIFLSIAADIYKVTLESPGVIGGFPIKPGDYRVVVDGDKATLTSGKTKVEVPVKVETGDKKFNYTQVESHSEGDKEIVDGIHVGGSKTTLVFKH